MSQIQEVTKHVLAKITPKRAERKKVEALSRELEKRISLACQQEGVDAVVRVEGSVAKDTWLAENPDIDVFMQLPTTIPRKNLGDIGLKIARKAAGDAEQLERFAEHPYLEIFLEGYRVDIVPCYRAKSGEWQSATDRTPYHTDYIKVHLDAPLRGEVRLLKRFMQGVGVYGAEIKIGGFSGYLCELLVLKYGSFASVLEAFAAYSRRVIIDIGNYYADRQRELTLLFPEPLVIIDPVDKGRNVASPVQPQKLYTFIAASRAFLIKPTEQFFYPPKPSALSSQELRIQLDRRGSALVFVVVGALEAVPDVLWGQLYRSKRSLCTLLELNDFKILRSEVWSNEKTLSVFVFELEAQTLPNIKRHLGPPLERQAECQNFLAKYAGNSQVIAGPYVEEGRWMVMLPRKNPDASALLKAKLLDGGKSAGVADIVAGALSKELKVLVNDEIVETYANHGDFAIFLTGLVFGKPFWLEA